MTMYIAPLTALTADMMSATPMVYVMEDSFMMTTNSLAMAGSMLRMSAVNALDAGAENLAEICAGVHAQCHNAGEEAVELDEAENGEAGQIEKRAEHAVIYYPDLHYDRGGTEKLNIGRCDKRQGIEAADGQQRTVCTQAALPVYGEKTEGAAVAHTHQSQYNAQETADNNGEN